MSLHAFIILSLSSLTTVVSKECAEGTMANVVKKYLVTMDPHEKYKGIYSDVWLPKDIIEGKKCSYSEYTKLDDGSIKEKSIGYDEQGYEYFNGDEYLKRTATIGIYEKQGPSLDSGDKYETVNYVFHADGNVIASYACEVDGTGWVILIQVKSEKNSMLLSKDQNDVKKSFQEAEQKMDMIFKLTFPV